MAATSPSTRPSTITSPPNAMTPSFTSPRTRTVRPTPKTSLVLCPSTINSSPLFGVATDGGVLPACALAATWTQRKRTTRVAAFVSASRAHVRAARVPGHLSATRERAGKAKDERLNAKGEAGKAKVKNEARAGRASSAFPPPPLALCHSACAFLILSSSTSLPHSDSRGCPHKNRRPAPGSLARAGVTWAGRRLTYDPPGFYSLAPAR